MSSGYFEYLLPYLDADPALSREDFLPNLLDGRGRLLDVSRFQHYGVEDGDYFILKFVPQGQRRHV